MEKNESADGNPIDKTNNNNHKDDKVNQSFSRSSSSSVSPSLSTESQSLHRNSAPPTHSSSSFPVSIAHLRLLENSFAASALSAAAVSRLMDISKKSGSSVPAIGADFSLADNAHIRDSKHSKHRKTSSKESSPDSTPAFGAFSESAIEDRIQALFNERRHRAQSAEDTGDDEEALDLKLPAKSSSRGLENGESKSLQSRISSHTSSSPYKAEAVNGDKYADANKKPGNLPCPQCHKTFSAAADLKAHLQRHVSQHPFVCLACGKGFKYEHSLNFHIKSYHGLSSGASGSSSAAQGLKSFNKKLSRFRHDSGHGNGPSEDNGIHDAYHSDEDLYEENNNSESNNNQSEGSVNGGGHLDMGFPPNVTPKNIQIKSEKPLITMLEGVHAVNDQAYILYKCCLCGFAFPSLEPMAAHIQTMHTNTANLTSDKCHCDKCGATFKWRSELQLHEQLHNAMEHGKPGQLMVPPFLQSNLALLNPYLGEHVPETNNNNHSNSDKVNGSSGDKQYDGRGLNLSLGLNLSNYKPSLVKEEAGQRRKASKETKSPVIDSQEDALSLLKENPFQPKLSSTMGEIEETAPGQFKCRFCDKTFDRIFSVHRHERVHTGYKPCICKVCGRGFSEKRNLRHHIIRFHSDGSGRELLKRARKDKSLAASTKQLAASVLKKAALKYLSSQNNNNDEGEHVGDDEHDDHKLDMDDDDMHDDVPSDDQDTLMNGNQNDSSDNMQSYRVSSAEGSSSRRRKGKPSKKFVHVEHSDQESEIEVDDEDAMNGDLDDDADVEGESKNGDIEDEDEDDDVDIEKDYSMRRDGNMSSDSNGGNHSENSVEGSLGKLKNHGAFFSSYSPRLGIVEKPIKRTEVCRPLLGPDGKYLYPCGYCQKTFCSLSDLNRHMNFHEDVRPFKCEYCDYQSRTNSQLKVHMMRHAGIKQYLCQICNYNGVTQSDLNRHCKTRSHVLRSANVCPLCSLGFSTRTLLEDHLIKFHDTSNSAASALSHQKAIAT